MASEKDAKKQQAVKIIPLLITVAVGLIIWFIPAPSGLEPKAWHLFAIFVATIIGFISKPLPMGAIAIFALAVTALTGTLSIEDTLSGFGNKTIWLIVIAFFISRGLSKPGSAPEFLTYSYNGSGRKHSAFLIHCFSVI